MSASATCTTLSTTCLMLGLALGARAENAKPAATLYAVAHDAPLHAAERLVDDKDTYRQFRVEFDGVQKDRVPAFLYLPKETSAEKHPGVLLQYGSGGNKGTDYITALGRQFVGHGLVVLTIDSPLRGERARKGKSEDSFLDREKTQANFRQYLGDYSRAVDYLTSRKEVDPARIGYVGISWGAITGIPFVAHDRRVRVMASIVGGGHLGTILGPLDPALQVGLIAPRPLLLLNVTKDQLVPRQFSEALHKAAGKGSKIVWVETDHFFHGADKTKLGEDIVQFLKEGFAADGGAH